MSIDAKKFIDAINDAGYEAQSYSGRGMYGRNCIGFIVERGRSTFTAALDIVRELLDSGDDDETAELIGYMSRLGVSKDSVGTDTIIYFPRAEWPEEDEDVVNGEDESGDEDFHHHGM